MKERAVLPARVSSDSGTEIKDPATGEVIGRVAFGTPGWSATGGSSTISSRTPRRVARAWSSAGTRIPPRPASSTRRP